MTRTTALVAAAGMGLALTTVASADSEWAAAVNGLWTDATKWSPMDVPDTALETATIAVGPGPYDITLPGGATFSIAGLVMSQNSAALRIQGGRTLDIAGGVFLNNGIVSINSNSTSTDAVLNFSADAAFNGTGSLILNRNTDARLETSGGAVLTNNATIRGAGVVQASLLNNNLVYSQAGVLELRTNDKINQGTMRTTAGSQIQIQSITIDNTGGLLEADEGDIVNPGGSAAILGGTLDSTGPGSFRILGSGILTLDGVNSSALINIEGGGVVNLAGGMINDGTVVIDSNSSSSDGVLQIIETGTIDGAGIVHLNRTTDARLESDPGVVLTIGTNQRVEGSGRVGAALVNSGVIDSDLAGGVIDFYDNDKTNDGLMRASNLGTLNITPVTITQTNNGVMRADNGVVLAAAGTSAIVGGALEAINGGRFDVAGGGLLTLTGVSLLGPMNIVGGGTVTLVDAMTNNGSIVIDSNSSASDGVLTTGSDVAIGGTGSIVLFRNTDSRLETMDSTTLTLGAGQTVTGGGLINARIVNEGLIEANGAGAIVALRTEPKTNNNMMRANPSATLDLTSVTTTQGPGASIVADGGTVLASAGTTRVENGDISTLNGGMLRTISGAQLELLEVDFSGLMNIEGSTTVAIENSLTNDGAIVIDSNSSASDGVLTTVDDAIIDGVGTIRLNRNTDARIDTADGTTLSLGTGQTVLGGGVINGRIINNGLIDADVVGGVINLATNPKTNNGTMKASLGVLDITGVTTTQSATGLMSADDAGQVRVSAGITTLASGTLSTTGNGMVRVLGGADLTLDSVLLDGVMNTEGGALVRVAGNLTNDGTVRVNSNGSASNAEVSVPDGSSVLGSGEIALLRGSSDSRLSTPGTATIGASQTVSGLGRFTGSWIFRGTLAPGNDAVGSIFNEGTLSMRPATNTAIEIASTASNGFDRVLGSGIVELDGDLDLTYLGYTPVKNDVFRIVEGSSVTGHFETINGPALSGGLVYAIFYDPTFAELRITCGPDLNLDGLLDFFDVLYFLQEYSAGNPDGDYNEDGLFDFFDVLAFLQAFAAPCP